jgi:hypothetical protein
MDDREGGGSSAQQSKEMKWRLQQQQVQYDNLLVKLNSKTEACKVAEEQTEVRV